MKVFDSAYLKLAAYYTAIIMSLSLAFSVWVYNQARFELRTGLNKVIQVNPYSGAVMGVINDRLDNSRGRLFNRLFFLNLGVLIVGAGASYLLARRTMEPIEDAVQAQERFTADAAHELRTPLAAMKAETEVALRAGKLSDGEARHLLHSNLEEIDRLSSLAEGLLALSRADANLKLQPVPLDKIVKRVVAHMNPLAELNNLTIKPELQPVTASGDEPAIEKIVGILLDNAIKYSKPQTEITVLTYKKDGHTYLEVKDQGIGIKASELPHIFDRFYRADTSRSKQNIHGHGLGLSIAKKLAEYLGADITVASKPDHGSTFAVAFRAALKK